MDIPLVPGATTLLDSDPDPDTGLVTSVTKNPNGTGLLVG